MQEKGLQKLITYLHRQSPFYKELFAVQNINAAEIKTLDDLNKIPTTAKEDLQLRNDDFFAYRKIRSLNTVLLPAHSAARSPLHLPRKIWNDWRLMNMHLLHVPMEVTRIFTSLC